MVGAEETDKVRIRRAAAVEVGANGDDHGRLSAGVRGHRDERADERGTLVLVAAQREDFLELVDSDKHPLPMSLLGNRSL